jgi:hypothetical protein
MFDLTKCLSEECPRRKYCGHQTLVDHPQANVVSACYYSSYIDDDGNCPHYIYSEVD